MKWLFLLLLLINAAFFAWQWQHWHQPAEPVATPGVGAAPDEPQLRLLDEAPELLAQRATAGSGSVWDELPELAAAVTVEAAQEPVAAAAVDDVVSQEQETVAEPDTPAAAASSLCFALGPFREQDAARQASVWLARTGLVARTRPDAEQELLGYWVYVPPLADRAAARELTKRLQSKAVRDILIVPRGSYKNAVSLGLFSTRRAAETRRAALRDHGIIPTIEEAYRDRVRYWLDFSSTAQPPLSSELLAALISRFGDVRVVGRPCG